MTAAVPRCRRLADRAVHSRILLHRKYLSAGRWSGLLLLQQFYLLDEVRVVGYSFLDEADCSLLVDEIGQAASSIGVPELFVAVRYQGEFNIVFLDEFADGLRIVVADPDDFRIELFKCFQITLEVRQFACSDGAENGKIESQNDIFLAFIVGQRDFAL